MANISVEQTQQQARKLLDLKVESVTALVKARQRVADLREQLSQAEKDDKRAYVRATKDGWTIDQLKSLGLENGAAGRRRNAARKTTEQAPAPQHNADAEARQG